ncbi:MAG: GNAT family N-acetyltransferase [Eubacterium sp.]|nr:GNAT family N-acetyltransferase [Eubacterium sp.]
MRYVQATNDLAESVCNLVQNTIKTVYPKYYPLEVVDFFCELHSKENISNDILNGNLYVLYDNDILVGTGSFRENHITRVYVSPEHQGRGYGTYIINQFEKSIKGSFDVAVLDASLSAVMLYEKLGYKTIKHNKYPVKNNAVLIYEVMVKNM